MTDSLIAVARQRMVLATIADAIVAAATGKGLRVVIDSTRVDQMGFADHLARALHARGRPCQCLPSGPRSDSPARPAVHGDCRFVTVIVGGPPGPNESTLCRVAIRLETPTAVGDDDRPGPTDSAADDPGVETVHGCCDIVLDYHDPEGPIIRHIQPTLVGCPDRS
jgi:hypothetical protein